MPFPGTNVAAVILTVSNMVGSVVIITVLEHYFSRCCHSSIHSLCLICCEVIAVVGIAFGYSYFAAFYRASARELKRIGRVSSH